MEVLRTTAAAAHGRAWPEPAAPTVWCVEVDGPALVLGSTQPDGVVDGARAAAVGVDVVRRRSGGGAVLLRPGEVVWIDVLVPAGDPLWEADVGRAFGWLGRAWVDALGALGVAAVAYDGPLAAGRWSSLVCFGGLGPGEVTVEGRKIVGISQRRTRAGALFQCAVLVEWDPSPLLDLLVLTDDDRTEAAVDLAWVATDAGG
ncbi:MAG: lipoate---protein ligase, partial [Actinomycetota bacterium]|nr:lipoate---protein ligase [Actinomycetota bacterium]